tara:strand:+ start:1198 stop:2457 length:1260 start_codon:yes stop_codon:yes gene_type:complete
LEEKKKIFIISDHPLSPSGVGTQTRYMIEALLKTGKYRFLCFGGAVKHADYNPVKTKEWGDDWVIYPIDGYGTQEMVRSVIRKERPDMLWFMTDPRFWGWLWEIEDEIRPLIPMVYYHVWDNYPYPHYNKPHYLSCDVVTTISKVTNDIVATVAPEVDLRHVSHAVDTNIFKPLEFKDIDMLKTSEFSEEKDKVVFFWNNRNARRKQSGTLIFWFKKFLDKVGHDNAMLIMHTDVKDPNGQDLEAIIRSLNMTDGQVKFSTQKVDNTHLSMLYNVADCTINISDAEGFGLSTLESLACGTPIIVNMTGGLQEQVTDGEEWFGIGIEPSSKAIIGSQDIPYIREDRINEDEFIDALCKIYEMTREERRDIGLKGREHVLKSFSFEEYAASWERIFDEVTEKYGSWDTRKGYNHWTLKEVK